MLSLNSFLLFSDNPKKLAEFYKQVFNVDPSWGEVDWTGFAVGAGFLAIGPHEKVKGKNTSPERMMFNLETSDVLGEFKRIKGYGVKVVKDPYHPMEATDMWVATFEDPDGNYFQLMSPMK